MRAESVNKRRLPGATSIVTNVAVAAITALAGMANPASAAVWRCGNSYSDQPCSNGKAVQAEDARSTEQRHDALQSSRSNAGAAQQFERERKQAEAAQPQPILIGNPAPAPTPHQPKTIAKPKKPKRNETGHFVARDPTAVPKTKSRKSVASP